MVSVLTSVGHNTHQAGRLQPVADKPLATLLKSLDLTNTVVTVLSDHGLHFGPHLETEQGQFEHRNPVLQCVVPKQALQRHPKLRHALRINQRRLVTSWDIHLTLKHLTTYPSPAPAVAANHLSSSLLEPISAHRTCAEAGIPLFACLCASWRPIPYPEFSPEEYRGHTAADLRLLGQAVLDDHVNTPLDKFGKSECMHVMFDTFRTVESSVFHGISLEDRGYERFYLKLEIIAQPGDLVFSTTLMRRYEKEGDIEEEWRIARVGGNPVFVSPTKGRDVAYVVDVFNRLSSMNAPEHMVPDNVIPSEFRGNRQMCVIRS